MTTAVAFRRHHMVYEHIATTPIEQYRIDVTAPPCHHSLCVIGPGTGLRLVREGSPDFFSFSELAESLVEPGMTDLQKALAVYRFCTRNFYHSGIGFGGTEMTRFINSFGYSYCWGLSDCQHLLYEAAGLRARSPVVNRHSVVEVFLEGRWRMLDVFLRMVCPSPSLDGIATGANLHAHPEMPDAVLDAESAQFARLYWSSYGPGGTYEPWQDSRSMLLHLRRGEQLRIVSHRREAWCIAPCEPSDCTNGEWSYCPPLDDQHLEEETEYCVNVIAEDGTVRADDPARPALLEYRLQSPHPFVSGSLMARTGGEGTLRVSLSTDERKTWTLLAEGASGEVAASLEGRLAYRGVPASYSGSVLTRLAVGNVLIRLEWTGQVTLHELNVVLLTQIHTPSIPQPAMGMNRWMLIGENVTGTTIQHTWDSYPEFRISNTTPLEGETVALSIVVHNRGTAAATDVPVRFTQAGTEYVLGAVVIPRLEPGEAATATLNWTAAIVPDRAGRVPGSPKRYRSTRVTARLGSDHVDGEWSGVAYAEMTVRPRPVPRFSSDLIAVGDVLSHEEPDFELRAALAQQAQSFTMLYQVDVPLSATLTPYLGHPDEGGIALAPPVRLADIQPSEFGVAKWRISAGSLPEAFTVWIEACCDDAVLPERRRLLASKDITLAACSVP